METLLSDYMESVERIGGKPDKVLLAPVLEVFEKLKQNQPQE